MGFDDSLYMDPVGLSGGLALWWKNEVGVRVLVGKKNLNDKAVVIPWVSSVVRIYWIYRALVFKEIREVWEEVKRKAESYEDPLMCIGDFNDVANMIEKEDGKRKENGVFLGND